MSRQEIILISLAASFLALSQLSHAAQVKEEAAPIRRIDHIMIRADHPGEIYTLFTKTMQLPVAWPLALRGGVTSGGVGFGNVNVEAIQFPGQQPSPAQLIGFGFETTPLSECLAELVRRGITYYEARPFALSGPDGSKKTLFTNVTLRQFSDSDSPGDATMHNFLSEYSPAYVDVGQRRERLRMELAEKGGGPLGVKGVKEVVIGATDLKTATTLWGKLLGPRRPSAPGLWQVSDGPAIRVVRAGEDKLQGLVIEVASLRQAKTFLEEKGLLGRISGKEVMIDPSKIEGLTIRLVEHK